MPEVCPICRETYVNVCALATHIYEHNPSAEDDDEVCGIIASDLEVLASDLRKAINKLESRAARWRTRARDLEEGVEEETALERAFLSDHLLGRGAL